MKTFVVFLPMLDEEKSRIHRPEHLDYLESQRALGRIFANGRFVDGWGGMVIYRAASIEEAQQWAEDDPFVRHGARRCEVHEWDMVQ
ncbi:YciI family protein [Paenibacillus cremeus]|uniref:YCII-related domain-containing protein n=1 Tax=Paenibacillus cremeus TaxID=2163881 RepID=A0A559JK71_9BACL|nr:YciI family protein [Paenibacillus cremeus]TVY00288.1 hypothetical protein FPZ49_33425 [Paenibacillus cremeus]